jgi:hypothetical protein
VNETLKKLLIALAAGVVGAVGAAVGQVAADAIRERYGEPPEEQPSKRRKRKAARR